MPEGPSLRRWCSMISPFQGRKITRISGSSKSLDKLKWSGSCLSEVKVKGKQLYLHLERDQDVAGPSHANEAGESMWLKCHFLMWGSVRVNEFNCKPSKTNRFPEPRLVFYFSKEEFIVFYGGSFGEVEHPPGNDGVDILSDNFDISAAVERILVDRPVCFTLLNQVAFSGLGNIIKNEVLFETGTHPMQLGSRLSRAKATEIVNFVVSFSKRWLEWKMEEKRSCKFGDWTKIYKKAKCPYDHCTIRSLFGPEGLERITYWCPECQPEPEETHSPTGGHDSATNSQDTHDGRSESSIIELSQGISPVGHDEHDEEPESMISAEKACSACGDIQVGANAKHSSLDHQGSRQRGEMIKREAANTTDTSQSTCDTSSDLPAEACVRNCEDEVKQKMHAAGSNLDSHNMSEEKAHIRSVSTLSCPPGESGGDGDCRPFKKVKIDPTETTSSLPISCIVPDVAESPAPHKDCEERSRMSLSMSEIRVLMKRSIRVDVRRMNMTEYEI